MKYFTKFFVFFLIISLNFVNAGGKYGTIGKLFTWEDGIKRYGEVLESVEIDTHDLVSILDHCENYMMFTIKNGEVIITDDNRNVLTNNRIYLVRNIVDYVVSKNDAISDDEILTVYSKSRVLELIEKTGSKIMKFEKRERVYCISDGHSMLMERALPCPPMCD